MEEMQFTWTGKTRPKGKLRPFHNPVGKHVAEECWHATRIIESRLTVGEKFAALDGWCRTCGQRPKLSFGKCSSWKVRAASQVLTSRCLEDSLQAV